MSGSSRPAPVYVGYQSPIRLPASARPPTFTAGVVSEPVVQSHVPLRAHAASTPPRFAAPLQRHYQHHTSDGASSARFDSALPSMNVASSLGENHDDAQQQSFAAARSHAVAAGGRPAYAASKYASPFKAAASTASASVHPAASASSASDASLFPPLPLHPTSIDSALLPSVHAFLQSLYPGPLAASAPRCELTPYTVHALATLQEHVRANDEQASILEEDMREAAKEYAAEATRLQCALSRVGLSAASLSEPARSSLATLTLLAQLLALKNVEPATYLCGLVDLRDSYHESLSSLRAAQQRLSASQAQTQKELALQSELRRLSSARADDLRSSAANVSAQAAQLPYFETKRAEYERELADIEHRLARAGYNDSLSHEALEAVADEIAQITREIEPLEQQLHTYKQLPPDLTLAQVRVAEARQELAELEAAFTQQVQERMQQDEYEQRSARRR